jgi:hypothetical protein
MRMRPAVLSFVAAVTLAAAPQVKAAPVELVAIGTVVSTSPDSLVVRTDDHGHRIAFAVDRSTTTPEGLAVGRHVRVVYHALGATGQAADKVALLEKNTAKASR